MTSRRDFIQRSAALAALLPFGWKPAFGQEALSASDLLDMQPTGNLSIIHLCDIHAQLKPLHFREPSVNIGVGEARGHVPHITGRDFLELYGIEPGSALAHALTHEDFTDLARAYGPMGGLDRIAHVIRAIRAERGEENCLLLDGGDTWQNSFTALETASADMVELMGLLKPDAMVGHWEFTLGEERVLELVERLGFPFLGQNVRDTEWEDPVFDAVAHIERGGTRIAVIGQSFPYTPIANPRWMIPEWSFGIREDDIRRQVEQARAEGAEVVILLSHNGFNVDRKMAGRVDGIDVILTAHTHDALPEPLMVNDTMLIASGSHGKFVSRLDLDVRDGGVQGWGYRLIPIFSEVIPADDEMAAAIARIRDPYEDALQEIVGVTETLLFRRGTFNGTMDDLLCDAMLEQRDAEIALSPGFRWGAAVLPGEITVEDIFRATALTYPECYRMTMTGEQLHTVLEDVAENAFNPDPYYQQGGDMVRVGGLGYSIDINQRQGSRITEMVHLASGEPIEPGREYIVSGWASVNEGTEGPPIWEVAMDYLRDRSSVAPSSAEHVRITGI
jgi:S-sulfosulfanyl-L-cysteine sulfohydrolase